jgi:predicted ATPase
MDNSALRLTELQIRNFGCLRDVTLGLEPLTVLVGPNDSGKTTVLRALEALAAACAWHRAPDAVNGWARAFPGELALERTTLDGRGGAIGLRLAGVLGEAPFAYGTEVFFHKAWNQVISDETLDAGRVSERRVDGKLTFRNAEGQAESPVEWGDNHLPLLHKSRFADARGHVAEYQRYVAGRRDIGVLADALAPTRRYLFRPEQLRAPVGTLARRAMLRDQVVLEPSGFGLARAIDHLLRKDRPRYQAIEASLRQVMPWVERIDIDERIEPGRDELGDAVELVTKTGARVSGNAISDGVLLYLAYLYLARSAPGGLLLIEEPETGIHPGLLRKVMALLRAVTTGALGGPPTQVILTTHSPLLLNEVKPEEIRVFSRNAAGEATVVPFANAPDLDRLLDFEGPGEIWVNEGESYITGAKGLAAAT